MDEILTIFPSSFSSFNDMLAFATDKINVGSYLYFVTVWGWAKIFSSSALALRLFSCIGFCIGLFLTWTTLRKVYGAFCSSVAVIIVFLNSYLILGQNAEARFYGMLFGLLSALFFITVENVNNRHVTIQTKISLLLINGCLPLTHIFGFAYSLMFLIATILVDFKRGYLRFTYYLSSLAGWMLFVPFISSFKRTLELSRPHFWISKPSVSDLMEYFLGEEGIYQRAALIIAALLLLSLFFKKASVAKRTDDFIVMTVGAFALLFPILIWSYSQLFKSLFLDRYMIIFQLGLMIMIAKATSYFEHYWCGIGKMKKKSGKAILMSILIIDAAINARTPFRKTDVGKRDYFPKNLPVAVGTPHSYLPRSYYNPEKRNYYFILDWEVASDSTNTLHATQDFQVMQALKKHLPEQKILTTEQFLEKFPAFVAINNRVWFERRIKGNQKFSSEDLGGGVYIVTRTLLKNKQ